MHPPLEPLAILGLELDRRVLDVEVTSETGLEIVEHDAWICAALDNDVR